MGVAFVYKTYFSFSEFDLLVNYAIQRLGLVFQTNNKRAATRTSGTLTVIKTKAYSVIVKAIDWIVKDNRSPVALKNIPINKSI